MPASFINLDRIPQKKRFWTVAIEGRTSPRIRYASLAEAVKAANDLALLKNATVYVLEIVGGMVPPPTPTPEKPID